jgi:uncharacterized coiled-coil protein SlyX
MENVKDHSNLEPNEFFKNLPKLDMHSAILGKHQIDKDDYIQKLESQLAEKDKELEEMKNFITSQHIRYGELIAEKSLEIERLTGLIDKAWEASEEYKTFGKGASPDLSEWKKKNNL